MVSIKVVTFLLVLHAEAVSLPTLRLAPRAIFGDPIDQSHTLDEPDLECLKGQGLRSKSIILISMSKQLTFRFN